MKQPSDIVKLPRAQAEHILKLARMIQAMGPTEDVEDGAGYAYARALGRANAAARELADDLAYYMREGA